LSEKLKQGAKYDDGKLRYDLIPIIPLALLAHVYTLGAIKYSDRNWEMGIDIKRIHAAMMRHYFAYKGGERLDQEDGQHHLSSMIWGAMTLIEYEYTHPELFEKDEEPKPYASEEFSKLMDEYFQKTIEAKRKKNA